MNRFLCERIHKLPALYNIVRKKSSVARIHEALAFVQKMFHCFVRENPLGFFRRKRSRHLAFVHWRDCAALLLCIAT